MKLLRVVLIAIVLLQNAFEVKSQYDVQILEARAFSPIGRTVLVEGRGLELISSGSHFGISFEGKECRIFASLSDWQDHNYLQYELDGVYQKRLMISKNDSAPILIQAGEAGKHTVWIYKATEAHSGPIFINKVTGEKLHALKQSPAPLIEFVGNSITCGAAADPSEVPCGTGAYHDQHNAYLAYGPRLARSLKANFVLSSVSGIGVYRNWNSEGPTMPQVYEKTDFQYNGNRYWDFASYSPAVVSIALGTNDFSKGDGKINRLLFDSAAFVSEYIRFVQLVKAKYPHSQIALLSSPMAGGANALALQNCLKAVKTSIDGFETGKPIALYFFNPMQARGCSGHPSVDDHRIMAAELQVFFKSLLDKSVKRQNTTQ